MIRPETDIKRAEIFLQSDAYIVTPGGDGSFCEGAITHNRNLTRIFAGESQRPLTYLNMNGFYNNVRRHFNVMTDEGYSNPDRQAAIHFVDDVDGVANILWPTQP